MHRIRMRHRNYNEKKNMPNVRNGGCNVQSAHMLIFIGI